MKRKGFLAILTAMAMIGSMGVCVYAADDAASTEDVLADYTGKADYKIGFSQCTLASPFYVTMKEVAEDYAKQMDPVCSKQDDIGNLRTHIAADGMRKTVFQIPVSNLGRKIPDDHAFIVFHHGVNLLFSFADVYLAADIVFILSGVHLVDDISGITVAVDHQKPSGSVQLGINKATSPDPEDGYYNLNQRHFYDRTGCKEPAVDQGDLKIRYNIGTDAGQCQRIKHIDSFQIAYLQSSVKLGKHQINQCIDQDQHPVTFSPEWFQDQATVKIVPHISKDRRLCNNDQACQTKHHKSFIIFSFTSVHRFFSLP